MLWGDDFTGTDGAAWNAAWFVDDHADGHRGNQDRFRCADAEPAKRQERLLGQRVHPHTRWADREVNGTRALRGVVLMAMLGRWKFTEGTERTRTWG
jgi:hypothetical protein